MKTNNQNTTGNQGEALSEETGRAPGIKVESFVGGFSLLLFFTIAQRFIGFGRNLLFCRWLDPAELGRWNLAFSLLLLAAPLVVLGLPGSFGRYVEHYRQKGQLKAFLRRISLLTIVLATIGITAMIFLNKSFAWLFLGDASLSQLLIASVVCLAFVTTFNFMVELFTALRQLKIVSFMQIANSILFAVFSLALMIWWKANAMSIVLGYGLACLVTAFAAMGPLWRNWKNLDDHGPTLEASTLWTKILPFAGWIWFSDLLANLFTAADRYMIVHFSQMSINESAVVIGQYHSSLIIPALMISVAYMVGSVIMPYLTSDWEQNEVSSVTRKINGALQMYGGVAFAGSVAVILFSPIIFDWALQGKYTDGLSVLPWTLAFSVWSGMMTISICHLRCAEKAGTATIGPVIGLIINVGLNLALLPWLGLLGAVLATAAGNFLAFWISIVYCSRNGFKVEPGTIWIALMPLCLPFGLPIAMTAAVVTLWAFVRTEWICSNENRSMMASKLAERLPSRFAHLASNPIFAIQTTSAAR